MESDASSVQTMGQAREKIRAKTNAKRKAQERARTSRRKEHQTRRMRSVSYARKRATPERIALSSRPGSLRRKQWVTSTVQIPSRKSDGSSLWIRSVEELCELIMIDSGASVHMCPPDHGQENGLRNRVQRDHC